MQGCLADVGYVHAHLCNTIFFDKPANGFYALAHARRAQRLSLGIGEYLARDRVPFAQYAPFLAYIKGNGVGTPLGGCIEVYVVGHQKIAGTDDGCTGCRIKNCRPKVGLPVGLLHFFGQPLVLACADGCQVLALRPAGSGFVQVNRYPQFPAYPLAQAPRPFGCLLQRYTAHRDQRAYIRGAHARVLALVLAHINAGRRLLDSLKSGFYDGLRAAHKGDYRPVGGLARVYIEQLYTPDSGYGIGNGLNDCRIAAFAKVRHTFDDGF